MSDHRLPIRRIRFEFPDGTDPIWNRRFPEFSCAANSISMLMPYAEPYFVASVRSAIPQLDEPLRSRAEDFARQELAHQRQHRRFNDAMLARYPHLVRVQGWIAKTYPWFGRTRSQRFNLAFAAGSEAIAFALARWTERHLGELFDDADPLPATLYLWHLAEEVEHKTVAFDVYEAVDGSRRRYAMAMTLSLAILGWFVLLGSLTMLAGERRLRYPVTYWRLAKWAVSLGFVLLPTIAVSALRDHHPSRFTDPVYLPRWLQQYDPETETMPLWGDRDAA